MKLVGIPILRPLTFKCKILGQFESLKIIQDLYCMLDGKGCHPAAFFPLSLGE